MRRHESDSKHFSLLRKLDDFAKAKGISLQDPNAARKFIPELFHAMEEHRRNPIRLYGLRTEAMFAYIAAAMGEATVISEEDSGTFYANDENLRRPDYRIVLKDKSQFLVETKNFHPKNEHSPYEIRVKYFASLARYSEITGTPLKFAIYWSHTNIWTLVDARNIEKYKSGYKITLPQAIKLNEMIVLGDCMIGSEFPILFRLFADKSKPRNLDSSGEAPFTVGSVKLLLKDKEIENEREKKLAWFLINYGNWEETNKPVEVENNKIDYFDFVFTFSSIEDGQDFAALGFLSQMLSRQYIGLTSPDEGIKSLTPQIDPSAIGLDMPLEWNGDVLKLCILYLRPQQNS